MRINANNNNAVVVDGQQVEDVDSFDNLRARITKHGGAEDDIKSRLAKPRGAFNKLGKIWRSAGAVGQKHQDKNLQVQCHSRDRVEWRKQINGPILPEESQD